MVVDAVVGETRMINASEFGCHLGNIREFLAADHDVDEPSSS